MGAMLLLALVAASAAGCAGKAPPESGEAFAVVGSAEASGVRDTEALWPWDGPERRYRAMEGQGGMVVAFERSGAEFRMMRREVGAESDTPPLVAQRLMKTEGGDRAVIDEVVRDERVEVEYDPPMVVLPRTLTPGGAFTQTVRMIVHPMGDRSRTRASGPLRSSITYEGVDRVRIGTRSIDAVHVRQKFTADLKQAIVTNTTDRWYMPGVGWIAERRREESRVLGVPIRSSAESWVIESVPTK